MDDTELQEGRRRQRERIRKAIQRGEETSRLIDQVLRNSERRAADRRRFFREAGVLK